MCSGAAGAMLAVTFAEAECSAAAATALGVTDPTEHLLVVVLSDLLQLLQLLAQSSAAAASCCCAVVAAWVLQAVFSVAAKHAAALLTCAHCRLLHASLLPGKHGCFLVRM